MFAYPWRTTNCHPRSLIHPAIPCWPCSPTESHMSYFFHIQQPVVSFPPSSGCGERLFRTGSTSTRQRPHPTLCVLPPRSLFSPDLHLSSSTSTLSPYGSTPCPSYHPSSLSSAVNVRKDERAIGHSARWIGKRKYNICQCAEIEAVRKYQFVRPSASSDDLNQPSCSYTHDQQTIRSLRYTSFMHPEHAYLARQTRRADSDLEVTHRVLEV